MSSSNVTDDIIAAVNALNWDLILFIRFWCIIMFILGFIGHSLNIYVFTRPTLYSNPCARYFLTSAIIGYLILFINLPTRLLQYGYSLSLFLVSMEMCKILSFLFFSIRVLPCWFIALASADRFFCSSRSVAMRAWSSIRVTKYFISLTILFIGLTQVPILIFYTINPQPRTCLGQPYVFQQVNAFLNLIIWSVIPSSAMFVFCYLTIRHTQQSTRTLLVSTEQNTTNQRRKRIKSIDRQLIQVAVIQSILFGSTSACGAIAGLYSSVSSNAGQNPLEIAKENFLTNVLAFIGLLGPCVSFYLCTLSSQLFRRELLKLFHFRRTGPVHENARVLSGEIMQNRAN